MSMSDIVAVFRGVSIIYDRPALKILAPVRIAPRSALGDSVSILIIEDDEGVGPSIAYLLRDEGYEVEVAIDGRAALDRLRRDPLPSLILLDLMMPGMDGIEFRVRQLADSRMATVPAIVISARPDVAARAKQLLVDDFLPKPMNFEELLHVVQNRAITVVRSERLPASER